MMMLALGNCYDHLHHQGIRTCEVGCAVVFVHNILLTFMVHAKGRETSRTV